MKYVILIYSNPESREIWGRLTVEQRTEGLKAYAALDADLDASGERLFSEALDDVSKAKRVAVTEGRTITTDGPFAEVKEHLAGFFLLDCESLERAVEIAARVPEAELGLVEVRPVLNLDEVAHRA
ncbi:MAG TPA: YciI family protein [Actinophytocola sp.]|uniref:YciI family protein n=1 Tax=Actinophytocola sp. TaxID=1872138 RepID=UPI002DDD46AE|nr:YciI family protein [Actinophytocola sp.]HEV2783936.1 YciI family protein [Actinophytocola sp.]